MIALRLAFSLLFLFATTVFSAVLPATSENTYQSSLNKLNPLQTVDRLECKTSTQRMRCYGGPLVTIQTCASQCTCEEGRISCSSFSHCDDSSMDTFCGSLCGCGVVPTVNSKSTVKKEIVISPYRYKNSVQDPEEDDDADNDDDLSPTENIRRIASYLER